MKYKKYVAMLARVQRKLALRICSAYRTVSLEAVQVLAGLVPLELLAGERTEINEEMEVDREELRTRTTKKWQEDGTPYGEKRHGPAVSSRTLMIG